ncbi:transport protein TonB [compost metagenome]
MQMPSISLNLKSSVSLSVMIHGGLFALCLVMGAREATVPLPIGVELMYVDDTAAPAVAAPLKAQVAAKPQVHPVVNDEDGVALDKDKKKPEVAPEPQVASTGKTLGNPNGNSEKGALTGREGVRNGQEVSAEDRYLFELRKLLERKKRYPALARKMGQTGRVLVSFTLAQDGSLVKSEVVEKAAFDSLNEAAHDLVKSIHGVKPFPEEIHKTTWNITLPIDYSIN